MCVGGTQLRLETKTPKADGPSKQEALEGGVGLLPEILASCMDYLHIALGSLEGVDIWRVEC